MLTHWGRVMHISISKLTIIGSNNGLSPSRGQAIIWTNGGILLIRSIGTNFSEIVSKIYTFSFKKIHLEMASGKWRPFCPSLNVLTIAKSWWCHDIETLSTLFAFHKRNPSPVDFPHKEPVKYNFDIFFVVHPNKLLNKHSSWQWF